MIHFPTTITEAVAALAGGAEVRAGGSDWLERRELGLTAQDIVDLRDVAGLSDIVAADAGGLHIGARTTLRELTAHPALAAYPALRLAADALATPQVRALATVGGAILQRNRCWYYRSAEHRCFKSGGDRCHARAGDHVLHAVFDLGPCVAPHPSTLGLALLTYDAELEVAHAAGRERRTIVSVFGDGGDASRDHTLGATELATAVMLPAPVVGERGGYFRATARAYAEWPLVEVAARLVVDGDIVRFARVAVGGVAPVPLRLPAVEAILEGSRGAEAFERAGEAATVGARPLPHNAYKVSIIAGAVRETLQRALAGVSPSAAVPVGGV